MAFGQPLVAGDQSPPAFDFSAILNHPVASAAQPKPKLNWLGVLADALSGAAGKEPLYTQSLMLQRQMAQQQQVAQQGSDRELQRQKDLFSYEQANKAPEEGETERLIGLAATLPDTDPRKKIILDKLNTDPIVTLTLPGDHVYSGPRSGLAAALSGAAPQPVGKITPLGVGGSASGSNGFR